MDRSLGDCAWRVRPARDSDRAGVIALWHEVDELHARILPAFFRVAQPRPRDEERAQADRASIVRSAMTASDEALLVAEDAEGGRTCGVIHLRLHDTPPEMTMVPTRRAQVVNLVVADAHRRRGCGRAMLDAGVAWARKKGATQIILTVWAGNDEAERFYTALGYRVVNRVLGLAL